MQKFSISLTAEARVSAYVEIAAATKEEAERLAIQSAKEGNVVWKYDGADDSTIEVAW